MRGQEDAGVHKVLAFNHNFLSSLYHLHNHRFMYMHVMALKGLCIAHYYFLTTCVLLLLVVSVHCSGSGVPPVTSHGSVLLFSRGSLS